VRVIAAALLTVVLAWAPLAAVAAVVAPGGSFVTDEFSVIDPVEQMPLVTGLAANFSLAGTFQPIPSGGGGGGGTAIPLPAGAWPGLLGVAIIVFATTRMKARRALRLI